MYDFKNLRNNHQLTLIVLILMVGCLYSVLMERNRTLNSADVDGSGSTAGVPAADIPEVHIVLQDKAMLRELRALRKEVQELKSMLAAERKNVQ